MKKPIILTVKTADELSALEFDLENLQGLHKHHTAQTAGYVSRKVAAEVAKYEGRFGKGYAIYEPSFVSSQYCHVTYWVREAQK